MKDIIHPLPDFDQIPEDGLRLVSYCPVCHYRYNPMEAKILEESDGAHLIHVRCRRCKSSILALLLAGNFGVSSVGLVTDLESYEISKFSEAPEISGDDVLEVFKSLKSGEITVNSL